MIPTVEKKTLQNFVFITRCVSDALRYFCIKSGLWSKAKEMADPEGDWGPAKRENRRGKYAEDDGKVEVRALKVINVFFWEID